MIISMASTFNETKESEGSSIRKHRWLPISKLWFTP
jgi:hypothetical protein